MSSPNYLRGPTYLEALHLGQSQGLMTHSVVGCYGNAIGPIVDVRVYCVAVKPKRDGGRR